MTFTTGLILFVVGMFATFLFLAFLYYIEKK